jgi:hypothetical protein
LRRIALNLAAFAICFALQGSAQPAPHHHGPPPGPLLNLLGQRPHAHPAQPGSLAAASGPLDASTIGSPLTLSKGWRVGVATGAAAAAPDFDDSSWATRDAEDGFADLPDEDPDGGPHSDPNHAGPSGKRVPQPDRDAQQERGEQPGQGAQRGRGPSFIWFRMHIKLAPGHGPLALLVELPVSQNTSMSLSSSGPGVDVFANGTQIQPEGPHGDSAQHYQQISRLYSVNLPAAETNLVLVVRTIYVPFAYTSFFATRSFLLGNREDLDHRLELWNTHGLFERLPRVVNSILLLVLALFLLVLYFTQKGHVEYLWLTLHELVQAPLGFVELAGASALLDRFWNEAILGELVLISAYLYFEFLIAFLALRTRWYIRALRYSSPVLLGAGPILLLIGHRNVSWLLLVVIFTLILLWIVGWIIFTFLTLIVATLRRNFEAGLLLIPLVLGIIGVAEPILTGGMSEWSGHAYHSPLTVAAGPIPIHFASIADFAGILSIVIIIFVRFLRVQRDQERASSELAAARSVQELMIPHEKIQTPGFEVDSIYNPANEVGGDFFHVQPTEDGGLLVVLGDVAGKGLKAAMNVSMLMGALRRISERNPARILESLNRVLTGSESFTTCQAAWFGANGELVLANAGHLPPYLNSQEVAIPGGLPLGVLADVTYDEIRLYLHPGDRILLMSDGVVEARLPSGELFGFDRVHNLSSQSAFYIADAAKSFGQEDDITVLTIRRLAQALAA